MHCFLYRSPLVLRHDHVKPHDLEADKRSRTFRHARDAVRRIPNYADMAYVNVLLWVFLLEFESAIELK